MIEGVDLDYTSGSVLFDIVFVFFFKHKTAYEMRISDWSSDVCSSDLRAAPAPRAADVAVVDGEHPARRRVWQGRQEQERAMRWTSPKIGRASCRERVCQYV